MARNSASPSSSMKMTSLMSTTHLPGADGTRAAFHAVRSSSTHGFVNRPQTVQCCSSAVTVFVILSIFPHLLEYANAFWPPMRMRLGKTVLSEGWISGEPSGVEEGVSGSPAQYRILGT